MSRSKNISGGGPRSEPLAFSHDIDLNLRDYFPYYEESNHPFKLTTGHSFSQRSDAKLVPIVGPARGVCLPYNIVFKICCALVQHGCIPGPVLDSKFYELLDPQRRDLASIEYVLEKLYYLKECCYEPVKWIPAISLHIIIATKK
ncbi:RNA-dependent RNA polymerase, eukaryotic-type [Artemisia annua]|uniref:RNA-dependent RNA polymerase, eukaryotic-type n=1 Tax=Artemisia annua TaxID=35608 RepID=A0A2U1M8C9_ARTAN|nr:RNA-dependent RNA polymerase, eukaryotic-type [Artemisia annua]